MVRILNLASGSKGNATLFESGGFVFLLDMGIGKNLLVEGLKELGFTLDNLNDVFVTHRHSDHIKGLCYLEGKTLYARDGALEGLDYVHLENYRKISVGPFDITCLPTSHDVPGSCGYLVSVDHKKIAYITDTGRIRKDVLSLIRGADAYIFESNHDLKMLQDSKRPKALKERIRGTKGHLSNDQAGQYLRTLVSPVTEVIALAHLSEECNLEELALENLRNILRKDGLLRDDLDIRALRQHKETLITL